MIPPWLQAIVLGVVQGATEFIPISSSGHLVLVPYLVGWPEPGLAFDVALHMGTAAAVVAYFRAELVAMAKGVIGGGATPEGRLYRRLGLLVALGSVPVALAGGLFKDSFERVFGSPLAVSGFLFVTAAVLVGGERWRDRRVTRGERLGVVAEPGDARQLWTGDWVGGQAPMAASEPATELPTGEDPDDPAGATLEQLGPRHALVVGLCQVVALLPGVSRSGATIVAGLGAGLTREAATRFSFLLALPALLGAGLLSLPDLAQPGPYSGAAIAGGVVAAFVTGYAAIRWLLALVAYERLTGFARWCVFVGVVGLVGYLFLGPPSSA
ncbi:MAG TPA: undecaprenyl-diphosphate phosphatase [Egibacteraceae bacterium]|nr:undecaprenyl-diphosphate phosphatase [Egibacteraceae bacterium]